MKTLQTEPYLEARKLWPPSGRCILAQANSDVVVVYQAYRPEIAEWAVEHQEFGGPWSFSRMSWIKPNFLWMMYRCGWASKAGQERVLAIHLKRTGFDQILADAVPTSLGASWHDDELEWKAAMERSDVRLQWDPDHDPTGRRVERRAIQLGLKGETLRRFATEWVEQIEDVTPFVVAQREFAQESSWGELEVPRERPIRDIAPEVAQRIGLDS